MPQGIVYMVQEGEAKTQQPLGTYDIIEEAVPGISISSIYGDDKIYRYVVCCYDYVEQALKTQNELIKQGFDAYVIAFLDGKRVTLKTARDYQLKGK